MSSAIFTGGFRSSRLHSLNLLGLHQFTLQHSKAASLTSAISKGLRKSQKVGFRGKEWSKQDDTYGAGHDGQTQGKAIVRRTADRVIAARTERIGERQVRLNIPGEKIELETAGRRNSKFPIKRINSDSRTDESSSRTLGGRRRGADLRSSFRGSDQPNRRSKESRLDKKGTKHARPTARGRNHDYATPERPRYELDSSSNNRPPQYRRKESSYWNETDRLGDETLSRSRNRDAQGKSWQNGPREQHTTRDAGLDGSRGERTPKDHTRSEDDFSRSRRLAQDLSGENRTARFQSHHSSHRSEPSSDSYESKSASLVWDKQGEKPAPPLKIDKHIPISIHYTTPASVFLYGTSVVEATLKSIHGQRRKLYRLYVYSGENREDANIEKDQELVKFAKRQGIRIVKCKSEQLRMMDKMSGGRPHNGYVLEASPLPQLPIESLEPTTHQEGLKGFAVKVGHQSREEAAINGTSTFFPTVLRPRSTNPLVIYLSGIKDPGNLGAIIRTANFLGASAIVVSTKSSALITPTVIKASAGATEHITMFAVGRNAKEEDFIKASREAGWNIYAAVAPGTNKNTTRERLETTQLHDPLRDAPALLLLGSEGEGLPWSLIKQANKEIVIPGAPRRVGVDSLNVSVASGLLIEAFLRKPLRTSMEGTAKANEGNEEVEEIRAGDKLF